MEIVGGVRSGNTMQETSCDPLKPWDTHTRTRTHSISEITSTQLSASL